MPTSVCCMSEIGPETHASTPSPDATISGSVGMGGANRPTDVLTIQILLNRANLAVGSPAKPITVDGFVGPQTVGAIKEFQKSQLGFQDGRVDPAQKTLKRLNEINLLASPGLNPQDTPRTGFPSNAALEMLPTAKFWATQARTHLSGLQLIATANNGSSPDPELFAKANTHFHLDRDPANLTQNLSKLVQVFSLMLQMFADAPRFFADGPITAKSEFADAFMGGFHQPNTVRNFIVFRPRYLTCGPMCRAAMIVHEGAHFVGGIGEIGHFAMEFPAPSGRPQDGSSHNYEQMTTSESMRNASSYAAFAIHVATGLDSRFGARNLAL